MIKIQTCFSLNYFCNLNTLNFTYIHLERKNTRKRFEGSMLSHFPTEVPPENWVSEFEGQDHVIYLGRKEDIAELY